MAKQHILIVDDDQKSLRVLEISLKKAGFSVTIASNGIDALEKVAVSVPELIISDVKMPKMNGYQFCQRIKDDPKLAMIPFIFLTSQRSVEDKVRGLELGVDDYLTKPIYIRELIARVRLLLQKKEKESLERVDQQNMFQGSLSDLGVVDLLQTIEIGRKTGLILLNSGSKDGIMYVLNGRIIDAVCGHLTGARAVYRLLTWNEGSFKIDFKPVERSETIELSTQGLIMEGMRRLDEFERLAEQLPPLDTVLVIDPQELLDQYPEGFPSRAGDIIQLFNGKNSILDVADQCGLDDLPALNIISKFYFQGLLKELQAEKGNLVTHPNGTITVAGPNPQATMAKVIPDDPPPGKPGIESSGEGIEIEIDGPELVRQPPDTTTPGFRPVPKQAESPLSESRMREMFDEVSAAEGGADEGDFEFASPESSQPARARHLRAVPSPAASAAAASPAPEPSTPPKPAKSAPPKPESKPEPKPEPKAEPKPPPLPKAASKPAPPPPAPPAKTAPAPEPPPTVQQPLTPPLPPLQAAPAAKPKPRLDEVAPEEYEDKEDEVTVPGVAASSHQSIVIAVAVSVVVTLLVVAGAGTFIFTSYLKPMFDRLSGAAARLPIAQQGAPEPEALDRLLAAYAPQELRTAIQQIDRSGSGATPGLALRHALAVARQGFLLEDSRLVTQGTLEFDRLGADVRDTPDARLVQAELEIYRERFELARQLASALETSSALSPGDQQLATIIRAFAQGRSGQLDAASGVLSAAASTAPDEIIAPYALGWLYLAAGDSAKAELWASRIAQANPAHGPALLIVARSQRRAGSNGRTLESLSLAERADPSDPRPAIERVDLRVKVTREFDLAFTELDALLDREQIRTNPVFEAWLLALKSMILIERGDLTGARVAYEQAKSRDRTRRELEEIARRLASPAAAAPVPVAVAAVPDAAEKVDYAKDGRTALRKGQYAKALRLLTKACEIEENDAKLWFDLGMAAMQSDQTAKAISAFASSALLDSNNAETHYYLGQLYSSERRNNMAINSYERFLKLAPNHPNAPIARAILQKLKK